MLLLSLFIFFYLPISLIGSILGHVQKYGGSFDQNSKTLKMQKNQFFFAVFSSIFKKSTPNFQQSFSLLILIYYHTEKIKKCLHNTFMIKN